METNSAERRRVPRDKQLAIVRLRVSVQYKKGICLRLVAVRIGCRPNDVESIASEKRLEHRRNQPSSLRLQTPLDLFLVFDCTNDSLDGIFDRNAVFLASVAESE